MLVNVSCELWRICLFCLVFKGFGATQSVGQVCQKNSLKQTVDIVLAFKGVILLSRFYTYYICWRKWLSESTGNRTRGPLILGLAPSDLTWIPTGSFLIAVWLTRLLGYAGLVCCISCQLLRAILFSSVFIVCFRSFLRSAKNYFNICAC